MSSINPHYTFEYSQPEAYRFSHDSVFLARLAFEYLRHEMNSDWRILDLCAGCGIVGLDFLFHCKKELSITPKHLDFLEIQSEYAAHFDINLSRLNPDTQTRYLLQNYSEPIAKKYDLILCNPPYFETSQGKQSPNDFKNRCRFYIDASFQDLEHSLEASLTPNGRAFVLVRNLDRLFNTNLQAEIIGDIRGTALVLFKKKHNRCPNDI